ncbi:related cytochrome b5 2 [Phialocephala subalpina]|uniref:Related cytochrome b5 2 n=1 Tax=Phialocephala subalpina TaxID=576137 RepID=A0A1L7WI79_9HELO|nr:related cytochrome b5 2 [Phialocephala subalpina]
MALREIARSEVYQHNTKHDLWLIVNGKVYDVTRFSSSHPGGEEVLVDSAGVDASNPFEDVGHSEEARNILQGLQIGILKSKGDTHVEEEAATLGARISSYLNSYLLSFWLFVIGLLFVVNRFIPPVGTLEVVH